MNRLASFAVLIALTQPAFAAETVLKLSETAHVQVHPDELVASLRATSTGGSAAETQGRVNAAIAEALAKAKAVAGVTSATGFYQVYQETKPVLQWHAAQSITLTSHDGDALLKLVGSLQGESLALDQLNWRVSDQVARSAQSEATRTALRNLRARADEAAGILGLRFESFREVRLDGTRPAPIIPFQRALPMAAMAAPIEPPSAQAQDADIQATVEADAVLGTTAP